MRTLLKAGFLASLLAGHVVAGTIDLTREGDPSAEATKARATAVHLMSAWSKALLDLQVALPGIPELDGGVICPACAAMHGRTIDAVWPLCWQWQKTGDERYLTAAKRLVRWTQLNLERPDGAYLNDPNMGWRGTTVFSLAALGRVLERWGDKLDAETRAAWLAVLRRQIDWCRHWMEDPHLVVNVNYRAGYALGMELASRVLKDERLRRSGETQAQRVLKCIAEDGLLYGEAKPYDLISPRGLRGVDIGYSVEETLPAMLEWAEFRGDSAALEKLLDCAQTHLWFILPDGGLDNSFGSRAYKWTYWGSRTADGILPMLTILARHNRQGARTAAERTLVLYARCTTGNGLLAGGIGYADAGEPTCIHHTFCHLKTLPFFLEEPLSSSGDEPLPVDSSFGVKRFPTCGATLVGVGAWRASFSENDVYFVDDNGKSTGGGSLTLLYHRQIGPLFAASMPAWSVVERMSMQEQTKDDVTRCLTPRLTCGDYMSVYDDAVDFAISEESGSVTATAIGTLTDRADRRLENGGFKLVWQIDEQVVSIRAEAFTAMKLVVPVLADGESRVELTDSTATVTRKKGRVKLAASAPLNWTRSVRANGLAFSPQTGFLAAELSLSVAPNKPVSVRLTVE